MKLTTALNITFAAVAFACPLVKRDLSPALPDKTHLYVCEEAAFGGDCENMEVEPGKCYNLPDNWKARVSSNGPDQNTFCVAYKKQDCSGKALPFTYPGIIDLKMYGYSDAINSYRCDLLDGFDGGE